jgi:hypothetical protein
VFSFVKTPVVLYILSRVSVTKTLVWIGESVYWIFTSRNYISSYTLKVTVTITHIKSSNHTLSLHMTTSNPSSATNFPCLSPTENRTVAPTVFKRTPLHGPHGKHRLPFLRIRIYIFCCLALGMTRATLKMSHVIAISPVHWRAD